MEIKLGDRVFAIPDECPLDSPKRSALRNDFRRHGPESFLTSRKLALYAGCVFEDLLVEGVVVVVVVVVEPVHPPGAGEDSHYSAEAINPGETPPAPEAELRQCLQNTSSEEALRAQEFGADTSPEEVLSQVGETQI